MASVTRTLRTITTARTGAAPTRWRVVIARWINRQRQRRALTELDDRMLRDIGVTRDAARREANRWFWDCWLEGRRAPDVGVPKRTRSFWDY